MAETKIEFKRGTLAELAKLSFQDKPNPTMECPHCKGKAVLIGVLDDPKGELCAEQRKRIEKKEVEVWPHDSCSIFLYLCGKCLEPTGKFTQA